MHISEFDYELPNELIAQEPLVERDASRMLILKRSTESWTDSHFAELPEYVNENDVLVINNTRVFPARLIGERDPSGGCVEVLLVRQLETLFWEALVRPGHRLKRGTVVRFAEGRLRAEILDQPGNGLRQLRFRCSEPFEMLLDEVGLTPLPPYIRRSAGASAEDRTRYQTVFASKRGAIAAPTAGLHFTARMLEKLRRRKVQVVEITLHVGYGTFEPVHVENIEAHRVSPELCEITAESAEVINQARARGGRVIAIGTTTTRALESAASRAGVVEPGTRAAEITITPGYKFRVIDALLTNFHLPRSSLLLLVCGYAGREFTLRAYRHAVRARYRFYSYGDCSLVI